MQYFHNSRFSIQFSTMLPTNMELISPAIVFMLASIVMMALNVGSFYAIIILHSATFRNRGAPSTIILLSSALSWDFQSFIFNAKVAYDCLHVIFVMNSIRRRRGLDQNEHEHDNVNIAMSRAVQNLSHDFKALLYVSLPTYLYFLLGVVAAVVILSPLINTTLWLQFFGNERLPHDSE